MAVSAGICLLLLHHWHIHHGDCLHVKNAGEEHFLVQMMLGEP